MELTITRPDDWHLHLRDGDVLAAVAPYTARQCGRAIVMPNLAPPVTTTEQALAYRERILAAVPENPDFQPLMTLFLTDNTTSAEIRKAKESGHVYAVKLYPAGATTNANAGVTDLANVTIALETMAEVGLPLLVHGEVTDPDADIFDREALFTERHLSPLVLRFPELKVVLEHVTTAQGVDFVRYGGANVAGTITAHHLLLNRNAIFAGGLNPHAYCLPVLKREEHREALVSAATGGSGRFFLGTDSAPHARPAKESGCGCAGIFTAFAALELYASIFEEAGALDELEGFASQHGPAFYGLEPNPDKITLIKKTWQVPETYELGDSTVVPLLAGQNLRWMVQQPA